MRLAVICLLVFTTAMTTGAEPEKLWLAVGHGGQRMLSKDGVTWEQVGSWSKPGHNQDDLNVAASFKGAFYVGGGYFSGRMTATRDGKNWSDGVLPGSSPIFGLEVLGDALYAIDLRGKVFKTADGEKWEMVAKSDMPTPTHWIRNTAQGNGIILGSGDFGPAIAFDPQTKTITVTQMDGQTDKNPGPKRVAFGNGFFVVIGQKGLVARTKDGKTYENNKIDDARGDMQCVEFDGKQFILTSVDNTTKKTVVSTSEYGLKWDVVTWNLPTRHIRWNNGWLYSSSYPPTKLARSKDGEKWEALKNDDGWHYKAYAYGSLSGGDPPKIPPAPAKK